ncbi:usg protein [Acuticoccus mangrovi]|uniref:Aspartate-semialdehyde dehydrogenase n=1 Tax=Acuticoccus mangrovi TaxID=2796142 RepID=A0A934ITI6_9HYPH|nr:aspartate-semialdehyde dehydrogenase [Acuticoccus mangrovi]MBJ3777414.1 aspartate-semialdehyde dehydrogenase [Acuticoccus mangrovi]
MASALERQLAGYSLTTAEIFYRLPDHPGILQTYVWQDYDQAPDFPVLERFLAFWRREIEGPLHSVNVCCRRLIAPGRYRTIRYEHFH